MRFIVMMLLAVASVNAMAQFASGTAFAVAPEVLVTNQHVIDGCSVVYVVTASGRRIGFVADEDSGIDLALLRVGGLKGATARLRNPRNIRLGEPVMVFGFPLAGSLTSGGNFTSGLVSGLRGLRDAPGEIQITAPVQPGNSGGPLMDASGLVVGVVQSKLDALRSAIVTGDIPQNVNFAVSLDVLANFLAKNSVAIRNGALSAPLDTARVAQLAQSFTYRVECRAKTQQADASPPLRPKPAPPPPQAPSPTLPLESGRLPSCSDSDHFAFWSNCVGKLQLFPIWDYVGEFRNGKFNGRGTQTFRTGKKYEGEFENGTFSGQGTLTLPNGEKYFGKFKDGKPNGHGIGAMPDGSVIHSGMWEDGNPVK